MTDVKHRKMTLRNIYCSSYLFQQKQFITNWPAGPMARRLTTNQEIAGSIPA
ncbi:predicted protein [Botrytis cinerea T4]|uniref:Uncharacterized protein n=1 Tax=Botryotinia fuckeliana (strain T4) TaxID=999810 RepID=G2YD65_BOTF4|nr:predicted protein [Botrytis cinerea T4]